jgi:hypothetical protein
MTKPLKTTSEFVALAQAANRARHLSETGQRSRLACAHLGDVKFDKNQQLVTRVSEPICAVGGADGLKSSRAPMGAIVKVATMKTLTRTESAWPRGRDGRRCPAVARKARLSRAATNGSSAAGGSSLALGQDCSLALKLVLGPAYSRALGLRPTAPRTRSIFDITGYAMGFMTRVRRARADLVGSAETGTVTPAGGKAARVCNTNI